MKIDSLQVLHIQFIDHKGVEDNPLHLFQSEINPFPAMTCSRHVYAFTSHFEGREALEAYTTAHSKKSEWLSGKDAYLFLLRWAVGAESSKIQNNDHFVLGQVRESWDYFKPSNSDKNQDLIHIMPMLFEDASNIRRLIQAPQFAKQNVKDLLVLMCENCASSRQREQKPAYDALLSEHQDYIDSAHRAHLAKRLDAVTRTMSVLNIKVADSTLLLPSMEQPMKIFRANLNSALEKRKLQDAADALQIAASSTHKF